MEKMTKEQALAYVEMMDKAQAIPDQEIDMLYSAGKLNNLILGAIQTTLLNLDYKPEQIESVVHECEYNTFDRYNANDLKKQVSNKE